jgi:hypothetical protein
MLTPFASHARLISTEQAESTESLDSQEKIKRFLNRADVVSKFEQLGLTSKTAQERVNTLTQAEVDVIAGKIDSLPAGGYITETGGVIIGVTLIIVIALITQRR